MKASVLDVARYSFCPKFYEQKGAIPVVDPECERDFASLLTYVFRKEFENESKAPWKSVLDKWTKIFWEHHQGKNEEDRAKYNRSLIALKQFHNWYIELDASILAVNFSLSASLYNHQLLGDIPVLLSNGDGSVTLIISEQFQKAGLVKWAPVVRYLSVAMDQSIPVSKVTVLSFINYRAFTTHTIEPNARFWETAMLDLLNILQSMQDGVSYSNTLACGFCPLATTCEALSE